MPSTGRPPSNRQHLGTSPGTTPWPFLGIHAEARGVVLEVEGSADSFRSVGSATDPPGGEGEDQAAGRMPVADRQRLEPDDEARRDLVGVAGRSTTRSGARARRTARRCEPARGARRGRSARRPEAEMPVRIAGDVEADGIVEDVLVAVGRRVEHREVLALAELRPVELDVAQRGALHVVDGRRPAHDLLDRVAAVSDRRRGAASWSGFSSSASSPPASALRVVSWPAVKTIRK